MILLIRLIFGLVFVCRHVRFVEVVLNCALQYTNIPHSADGAKIRLRAHIDVKLH